MMVRLVLCTCLDEYRKKGYGKEILISLIHQNRKLGKISFAQIEEKNLKATNLIEQLGFVKDRKVSWIKLIVLSNKCL